MSLLADSATYGGVYRATCLSVNGTSAKVKVPQLFANETLTIFECAGARPTAGDQGWVAFESGRAERPIWMGSESLGGGGGSAEVWIGDDTPPSIAPATQTVLWVDTDEPGETDVIVEGTGTVENSGDEFILDLGGLASAAYFHLSSDISYGFFSGRMIDTDPWVDEWPFWTPSGPAGLATYWSGRGEDVIVALDVQGLEAVRFVLEDDLGAPFDISYRAMAGSALVNPAVQSRFMTLPDARIFTFSGVGTAYTAGKTVGAQQPLYSGYATDPNMSLVRAINVKFETGYGDFDLVCVYNTLTNNSTFGTAGSIPLIEAFRASPSVGQQKLHQIGSYYIATVHYAQPVLLLQHPYVTIVAQASFTPIGGNIAVNFYLENQA